jgi:endonuclease-3 related protein
MENHLIAGKLKDIYRRLKDRYGPQHWWPARKPFEVIVGAILTQSAAWTNAEKALSNLRTAGALSPEALQRLPHDEIARLIHPCGYYNAKAHKLKAFVRWLGENYGNDLDELFARDVEDVRQQLLSIYGIGEETTDSIILYAAHKPSFVIDAYTRRIMKRIGIEPERDSYTAYQNLFTDNLPVDTRLFNEYHALLIILAKDVCRVRPLCQNCCLSDICHFYSQS